MSKTKHILHLIAKIAFGISLVLSTVFFSFLTFAVDGDVYYKEQTALGITATGLGIESEANRLYLDHVLADYMIGRIDNMDVTIVVHDATIHPWSEQALKHMADVRSLVITWTYICAGMLLYCIGYIIYYIRDIEGRKALRKTITYSYLIGIGLIALIVLVALVIGFDEAFTIFHKLFFSNDDWLFSPSDLLVRLLIEDFFLYMAVRGAITTVISIAVVSVLSWLGTRVNVSIIKSKHNNTKSEV